MLASAFAPVALAFGVLHLPGSTPTTLSIVLACEAIPLVVFLLVGGAIADRHARQVILFLSQMLAFAAFAALGVLIGLGDEVVRMLSSVCLGRRLGHALGSPRFQCNK